MVRFSVMSRPALLLPLSLRGRQYNTLWSRTQRRVTPAHLNPKFIAEYCSREGLSKFLGEYNLAKCLENCLQSLDMSVFEVTLLDASGNPWWNPLAVCEDSFVGF